MFRSTAALALLLIASAGAWAQLIARPPPPVFRPGGVIQPPIVPFVGSQGVTSPTPPPRVLPRPFLATNPFNNFLGIAPYWPVWYDSEPIVTTNYIPYPVPTPAPPPISAPPPPPDMKAKLVLNLPSNAEVWLADQQVDSGAQPLILESPELREGQRYAFNVKVKWKERDKMQERSRTVTVDAGESKSLTYTAAQ
jgi:uncharacterized protein (TIGR03000 family)